MYVCIYIYTCVCVGSGQKMDAYTTYHVLTVGYVCVCAYRYSPFVPESSRQCFDQLGFPEVPPPHTPSAAYNGEVGSPERSGQPKHAKDREYDSTALSEAEGILAAGVREVCSKFRAVALDMQTNADGTGHLLRNIIAKP